MTLVKKKNSAPATTLQPDVPDSRGAFTPPTSAKFLRPNRLASRPRSLAVDLVETLQARIKDGTFPLGTRMPTEAEIMNSYGVSRTVVREAISRLQQARLVVTQHGIGSFVSESLPEEQGFRIDRVDVETVVDLVHVLELRVSLETESAGLAATRRNLRQLKEISDAIDDFTQRTQRGEDTLEADFRFHLSVAEATQNPHFFELMRHLGTAVIPRARVNSPKIAKEEKTAYLDRVNREHRLIFEAIERQDPESARAAMRVHLTNSRERLRRVMEPS
jgi:GntR family transcriptional regulator, transcriptional repressor for pyruvate dehydrogenase complex